MIIFAFYSVVPHVSSAYRVSRGVVGLPWFPYLQGKKLLYQGLRPFKNPQLIVLAGTADHPHALRAASPSSRL